jgi:hypothetical protein
MIAKAHHRRVIVVMAATVGAAAVSCRLGGAGRLITGLFFARLLHPWLLGARLAMGARGAGGALLTGRSLGARLAHLARLLVGWLFGAGEAFRAGG